MNLIPSQNMIHYDLEQGSPQFIQIVFDVPVVPSQLSITFQGGFVGVKTSVLIKSPREDGGKSEWRPWTTVYPEDVNRAQLFDLTPQTSVESGIDGMKLVFEESSDFFGRITIYDLQTRGRKFSV